MSSKSRRLLLRIAVGGVSIGIVYKAYQFYVDKQKKLLDSQHVVIVGGGYAGTTLAYNLKGRGNFTLIDPRDAMHHNMAALRAAVEPNYSNKSFIPYDLICEGHFLQDKVIDIDVNNKEVILKNNSKRIPYTQLVLATGSNGPFPGKCTMDEPLSKNLMTMYENFTEEVKQANSVVIVGGGAVGVELAGDIATDYPGQKSVTVVHNTSQLVSPGLVQKARDAMNEKFLKKNIDVILDEKVVNLNEIPVNKTSKDITVKLDSGKTLKADLVVPCFGLTVNSDAYKEALGSKMNARGQLKVDDKLQVKGTDNIFAIGDCNDTEHGKLALRAAEQGVCTYNNLINIAQNKPLSTYQPQPNSFVLCVPIGRDGGFSQIGTRVAGDRLTRFFKAKDAFVKFTWGRYGLNPPK